MPEGPLVGPEPSPLVNPLIKPLVGPEPNPLVNPFVHPLVPSAANPLVNALHNLSENGQAPMFGVPASPRKLRKPR